MEKNIKEQLIKSVNSIKHKIKQMQDEEQITNLKMNKMFKPLTTPLQVLANNSHLIYNQKNKKQSIDRKSMESPLESELSEFEDAVDSDDSSSTVKSCANEHVDQIPKSKKLMETSLSKRDLTDLYDTMNIPCGLRKEDEQFFIGNSIVTFSNLDKDDEKIRIIRIDNVQYELTPGLTELLFRKTPNLKLVSDKDKHVYKEILIKTSVHKRDYNPNGQIKGDKSIKYREIIKPMFYDFTSKSGGSLPVLKKYKENTDLIYWDDPNELIDRLKLLMASRDAGNRNHDNEIISIIEELREAGIIKP